MLHVCLLTSGRIFEVAYGGEERFTISLGNWLTKRDQEVTLMGSGFATVKVKHLSKSDVKDMEGYGKPLNSQQKIRVWYPPYSIYLLSRIVMTLLWISKILSINMKSPITLIHAQDTGYSGLAAVLSGKLLRIPVIISSHGIRHKSLESIIKGRFRKTLLNFEYRVDTFTTNNANRVIVVNSSIKNYYESIIGKKIDVIPIPIKFKNFEYSEGDRDLIRKELGIDKNAKVIGFVGRFSEEKNLFTLLDSFCDVSRDDPSLKLVLVGTGSLESELKRYVINKAIQQDVIFCGVRYDINRMLSSFDIFILPSYIEGLSTALLEAMSSGRAIICSNILANQELVSQNHEALLVNPHETEELAHAIRSLSKDSGLRSKLGHNASIRASQYDEDQIFSKILEYYETLSSKIRIE